MELRDILAFMKVADHQSFTEAAESFYLSQPSLSKAVKRLEQELHVELLDRSSRRLRLTDAGKIVYEQGEKALAELNNIPALLSELKGIAAGQIKFGVPPLIGTLFFPEIALKFSHRYPNVKLELVEVGAKVVEQLVEAEEIDVGLVVLPVNEEKFDVCPFITDEFYLYVHAEDRLARKKAASLTDVEQEKLIVFPKHFTLHSYIINSCKSAGFTPHISYETSQWDLTIELIAAKMGVALLPKSAMKKQRNPLIQAIPIQRPPLLWRLGTITKKGSYQSFALKKLVEMMQMGDEE